MAKKRIIQADTDSQIFDFVSTYKYWSIQDGSEILNSADREKDFKKALDQAIDIAVKRGKQVLTIRVGASEHNSRTNDEMIVNLQSYYNSSSPVAFPQQQGQPIVLNGFNNQQPLNNSGVTPEQMQTYLNGALERQQQSIELTNKGQLATMQSEFQRQLVEKELALKREMFEQQMDFDRKNMERERTELERKRDELYEKEHELDSERMNQNRGLAGFLKGIATMGKDYLGEDIFPNQKAKKDSLQGQEKNEYSTTQEEDEGFETIESEEEIDNEELDVLDGFDKLSPEELETLELLIQEKKDKEKEPEKSEENIIDKTEDNE